MALAPPSPPDPSRAADGVAFLSASDAARELTILSRRFAAAFRWFAVPAPDSPPAVRIGLATASRVLGEHASAFAALVPESVLLASARVEGAEAPLPSADSPAGVLAALDRALASLAVRATPVADGALRRAMARARADLADLGASLEPPSGASGTLAGGV